jgi:TctA family transporter
MKKNSFLTLIKKNYLIIFVTSLLSQIMLFLPGISSSIALIIVFLLFSESNENYLFASGASNTSAMIVSPLILYFTQIARNGTSIFIKDKLLETLNLEFVVIILITGIISSICAFFLAKKISKTVLFILSKLNYKLVNLGIFLTIITISFIFDGFYGLIFLFISAVVGYFIIKKEIPRYFGMNTILSNVLLFYFSR